MHRYLTSVCLIAGTCIGGGMLALPLVLAKLGIIPSLLIMIFIWLLTYYTSLISVELNLQCEKGESLGSLGKIFSGNKAQYIGDISVKLLSYALLAAFLYGFSSILQRLMNEYFNCQASILFFETIVALISLISLLFPVKIVSKLNNAAFIGFIFIFLVSIVITTAFTDYKQVPWIVNCSTSNIVSIITVVFTSFGYQVIFHILRDYCGKNPKMLKNVFFWGSAIPTIVYMLWTISSLSATFKASPNFFIQIIEGKAEVGAFVGELSNILGFSGFQAMIWIMAILAIFTSILGVGVGLVETMKLSLKPFVQNRYVRKVTSTLIIIIPAYTIAAVVPNAFIRILGFAGAILVIIAILLPAYLFYKAKIKKPFIHELKILPIALCVIIGIGIMVIEFLGAN